MKFCDALLTLLFRISKKWLESDVISETATNSLGETLTFNELQSLRPVIAKKVV